MKSPSDDLKADPDERENPPDFVSLTSSGELVRGKRTRDNVFDAVLQLHEPASVAEIAALADHGTDATREYLEWFERMRIVKRVGSSTATYWRNQEYLTWRRIERVRNEYTPEEVRLTDYARATDTSHENSWEQLCDWRTARRRIEILEQAVPKGSSRHLPA